MPKSINQHIFALAPANEPPRLTKDQERLVVGKASWIYAMAKTGVPTAPTICLTRQAWQILKNADPTSAICGHWVSTLYKLVQKGKAPPKLVVRTAAHTHLAGLARVRGAFEAPAKDIDSIDLKKPLGRAIERAFDSYQSGAPVWSDEKSANLKDDQIVIVQVAFDQPIVQFNTRDLNSGLLGPVSVSGERALPDRFCGDSGKQLCAAIDQLAGTHMACLAATAGDKVVFLSARPIQAPIAAILEAACDRVARGVWTPRQAVSQVDPGRLPQLLHARLTGKKKSTPLASGMGVSPGAASGAIVFSPEDAARYNARGKNCILVSVETGPADIEGMQAAKGILTSRGGITSHAAVIARVTGKPCVSGVRAMSIDMERGALEIGGRTLLQGAELTIDGSTGDVYAGALPLNQPNIGGALGKLLDWADGSRTIEVRTNVETISGAKTALSFGAEGIGLARSEHMFFSAERMVALRRMMFSQDIDDRVEALNGLVEYQANDYAQLFTVMEGRPITVRLFDPPLHEFLPRSKEEIEETASSLGLKTIDFERRLERLIEVNPMLGHRGCRLAISHPEILEMQIKALVAGGRAAIQTNDVPVNLEIMVPFVSSSREVAWVRSHILSLLEQLGMSRSAMFDFSVGTMIELPRAAIRAGEIAKHVDFFSFGTNDLTQTTFGISRDDAPAFLAAYQRKKLYDADPFVTIDQKGVGELIKMAIRRGRAANPDIKIGICGEHAGDPESLAFFAGLNVDYVSCSPYRIPIARLALAQAAL